jgi:PTS hybrid protein
VCPRASSALTQTHSAPSCADAKSLLGILSLGLGLGARVEISAWDSHAQAAVDALAELVESGFGED